jgi:uncharacterized protein YndB with AHSA1/START domain
MNPPPPPIPTGRVVETATGLDLVVTRTFAATAEDVWASITEPERLGRWFGTWSGDAGVGRIVTLTMLAEEGNPTAQVTIDACDPPHHLAVSVADEMGGWRLEARVAEHDGTTTLELVHHLDDGASPGDFGPGWEYYLDLLRASRDGTAPPAFDDYHPALSAHFDAQVPPAAT